MAKISSIRPEKRKISKASGPKRKAIRLAQQLGGSKPAIIHKQTKVALQSSLALLLRNIILGKVRSTKKVEIPQKPLAPVPPQAVDPLERIRQRMEATRAEREVMQAQIGDPIEALANLLGPLPEELLAEDLEEDENGMIRVNKFAYKG
jgi:hypothetical protein